MTVQMTSEPNVFGILNVETGQHEYFSREVLNGNKIAEDGTINLNVYRAKKRLEDLTAKNLLFIDPK